VSPRTVPVMTASIERLDLGLNAGTSAVHAWLARGGTVLFEQAIFAGSNFFLNVTLAASIPAADFGAFAFSFALFMIAAGFYNGLMLEPATVLRMSLYDTKAGAYCRAQLALHVGVTSALASLLGLTGMVLIAVSADSAIGEALLGAAIASPTILLVWLARRFLYILGRQRAALIGSVVYLIGITAGLAAAGRGGWLSPFGGFMIMAAASAAGAAFMLWQAGALTPSDRDADLTLRHLARERWNYGRWLLAAVCIEATIVPGLTLITATTLGLGAVGALRAMQVFAVPLGHGVAALSALALPVLARDFGEGRYGPLRNKAIMSMAVVGCAALAFEMGLLTFQQPLEHLLYGGKFASYAFLIPILGAAALLEGIATMHAMVLSAVQRPRLYLTSIAVTAPCALVTGLICTKLWGITGAAIAFVVTAGVSVATRRWFARPWLSPRIESLAS